MLELVKIAPPKKQISIVWCNGETPITSSWSRNYRSRPPCAPPTSSSQGFWSEKNEIFGDSTFRLSLTPRGSTNFTVFLSNRIYPVFVHSVGFLKISKIPSSGGWVSFGHFPIFVSCSRHGGDSRSVQGLLAEGVLEGKRLKRWNLVKGMAPSALYFRHHSISLLFASIFVASTKDEKHASFMPSLWFAFHEHRHFVCSPWTSLKTDQSRWICDVAQNVQSMGLAHEKSQNTRPWGLANSFVEVWYASKFGRGIKIWNFW